MTEMDENNEFGRLRGLLDDAEIAPSRNLWPEIESKLDEDKKKPLPFWYWITGALFIVGIAGTLTFIKSKNSISNYQAVNQTDKQSEKLVDAKVDNQSLKNNTLENQENRNELVKNTSALNENSLKLENESSNLEK